MHALFLFTIFLTAVGMVATSALAAGSDEELVEHIGVYYSSDAGPDQFFSRGLHVDGDYAFVGETWNLPAGRVYIIDISDPSAPVEKTIFMSNDQLFGQAFGQDIAKEGDILAIGASSDSEAVTAGGAVYLFDVGDIEDPVQLSRIVPPDPFALGFFGSTVEFDGLGLLAVAAIGAHGVGAVYLYDISSPHEPVLKSKMTPPPGGGGSPVPDTFGDNMIFDGERLVVGDPQAYLDGGVGAVYVYDISDSSDPFLIQTMLPSHKTDTSIRFGGSTAIADGVLAVGADGWNHETDPLQWGVVLLHEFREAEQKYVEIGRVYSSDEHRHEGFGASEVHFDNGRLFVAASGIGSLNRGGVYIFDVADPTAPTLECLFYSGIDPDELAGFEFARRFGISNDTLILGNALPTIEGIGRIHLMRHNLDMCRGDLNEDGVRDVRDLLILINNWGDADIGADLAAPFAAVDLDDLMYLLDRWGACKN